MPHARPAGPSDSPRLFQAGPCISWAVLREGVRSKRRDFTPPRDQDGTRTGPFSRMRRRTTATTTASGLLTGGEHVGREVPPKPGRRGQSPAFASGTLPGT